MNKYFKTESHLSTDHYSLFHFLDFNRKVSLPHARTLSKLIKANGFKGVIQVIKTSIFDGVERYYILDGQHRFTACKMLGVPFHFEVTELNTSMEVANYISAVNTSSMAWGTNQFLKVWSDIQIKEYITLLRVSRRTKIQITPLVEIYAQTKKMDTFRNGVIKFPNESESEKIVDQLLEVDEFLSGKAFCRRAIIQVMRMDKYNHSKMVKAIKKRIKTVGKFSESEKDLKKELIAIM